MAGYTAHHAGVFVIDLALDEAVAESAVIFGGRDPVLRCGWRGGLNMVSISSG